MFPDDPGRIREAARACLRRVPLDRPLRLLGVRAGGLVPLEPDGSPRPLPGLRSSVRGLRP